MLRNDRLFIMSPSPREKKVYTPNVVISLKILSCLDTPTSLIRPALLRTNEAVSAATRVFRMRKNLL